jgi:hypothetical protein
MEDQERELTKHLEDKEYMKQLLLNDHKKKEQRWHSTRNWLILVCLVLAIVCGIVINEWLNEKELRYYFQIEKKRYSNEAAHYEMLYHDCLNQEE